MEGTRLQKIERLLQKELSDIFQKQTQAMHGVLVSVSVLLPIQWKLPRFVCKFKQPFLRSNVLVYGKVKIYHIKTNE